MQGPIKGQHVLTCPLFEVGQTDYHACSFMTNPVRYFIVTTLLCVVLLGLLYSYTATFSVPKSFK